MQLLKLKQRGLTLVEAVMVLGVSSMVLAGIIVFYNMASMSSKINSTTNQIAELNGIIHNVYTAAANYSTLNNTAMIDSETIPASMVEGSNIIHKFKNTITLSSANYNGGNNNTYYITLDGLPNQACNNIAVTDFGRLLVGLRVNSSDITIPATVATINSACEDNDNNIIRLQFM